MTTTVRFSPLLVRAPAAALKLRMSIEVYYIAMRTGGGACKAERYGSPKYGMF